MSALLVARDLRRVLEGEDEAAEPVTLVDGISLTIEPGEFVAIMGPSGSGKSSLLYLLGLLDPPTSGQIFLEGEDVTRLDEDGLADTRLSRLGFVFQFHFLLAEFSAIENVMLPMRKLGRHDAAEREGRAEALLLRLGLSGQMLKRPGQMSGGQRQRVAIARALANDPVLILTDEPTGNLDTASSANVREILQALAHDDGRAVVSVTHDVAFAAAADRKVILVDGKLAPPGFDPFAVKG